jgi:chemotaxis protein MotB
MRGGGWMLGLAGGVCVTALSGCVSLDDHLRLKAANRTLTAEKESVSQELFDERHVNDTLRAKVDATEQELSTKGELLANLRGENDLLNELRLNAKGALEDMAGRQRLGDITIPILPGPLDTALKRFADEHPSEVIYDPSRGTVKWKGDLLFPLGSDVVKDSSMESLRGFSEVLKSAAASDFEVLIVGHTDNRPIQRPGTKEKHPTNWHLSAHRSIAVGAVLQKFGYRVERIGVMGCSEYRPVADNSSENGQSQNRRVEIYLVPTGSIVQVSAPATPVRSLKEAETERAASAVPAKPAKRVEKTEKPPAPRPTP